jgi:deoxyribodipyrimidine photo-lyase
MAAYLCHFRGIRWQVGAKLFREFLLDGDRASNSCSWQWVESTFASKPYFMNKDNIASFSNHRWCEGCHAKCPFDAPYERLEQSLFANRRAPLAHAGRPPGSSRLTLPIVQDDDSSIPAETRSIVWVHDAAMSAVDRAIVTNPDAMLVFVFDSREPWAEHRYRFIREGWVDLIDSVPNRHHAIAVGDPATELERLARSTGCRDLHVSEHPNPVVRQTIRTLESHCQVTIHPRAIFAEYLDEPKRFSRYWEKVAPLVLGYRPRSGKRMR